VLTPVLIGAGQQLGSRPHRRRAGQGVATQLSLAHRQQSLGRGAQQGWTSSLLPEKTAAAGLAQPELGQQLERIQRLIEEQLLAHRQH